ncbi:MAG: N-acetylmuramoyl-L-alanine amidase-like domain-containing protein [Bacteroidota bacterium]
MPVCAVLPTILLLCLALGACGDPAVPEVGASPASNAEPTSGDLTSVERAPLDPDSTTAQLFASILSQAEAGDWAELEYGQLVQTVGEALLGVPYKDGLLDEPEEETLVVTLSAFDCVLYIENVLALANAIALGQNDYESYVRGVEQLRYRGGSMGSYCSRLHYFSDWIRDNESRGAMENITEASGGEPFDKRIDFMTSNRDLYPRLAPDTTYACIVEREADLRGVELFYIPQDRIAAAYGFMQAGDIIATATDIGGLDVTHTGFVHKTADGTGFMHASLSSKQVKISEDLQSYVRGVRAQVGVVLVRPKDPRLASGAAEPRQPLPRLAPEAADSSDAPVEE